MARSRSVLAATFAVLVVAASANPYLISGADKAVSTASAETSSYYQKTEDVCLRTVNWRNCGIGTVGLEFFADIDFGCCDAHDEHHEEYYGGGGHGGNLNEFLRSSLSAAGTCAVKFDLDAIPILLAYLGTLNNPLIPNPSFGEFVKIGKVWGDCNFNKHAEDCHGPVCNGMTLSTQGDIFVAPAKANTDVFYGPTSGTCIVINGVLGAQAFNLRTAADRAANPNRVLDPTLRGFIEGLVDNVGKALVPTSVQRQTADSKVAGAAAAADGKASTTNYGYEEGYGYGENVVSAITEKLGLAVVVSGTTNVVGAHDKVEEHGKFEYVPLFVSLDSELITSDTNFNIAAYLKTIFNFNNAPRVHPGDLTLQFYKEEY